MILGRELSAGASSKLEFHDPRNKYFLLGEGHAGGSVYRVVPPASSERPYVQKEYRLRERWGSFVRRTRQRIEDRYPGKFRIRSYDNAGGLSMLKIGGTLGEASISIFLKSDNVIVEHGTGKLTMADPF